MAGDLRQIPGVGPNMEADLNRLGYTTVESLAGQDPEEMYLRDCALEGGPLDRCVLYVYRLAVYYAEHREREPEKLKWWYWKDRKEGAE